MSLPTEKFNEIRSKLLGKTIKLGLSEIKITDVFQYEDGKFDEIFDCVIRYEIKGKVVDCAYISESFELDEVKSKEEHSK